MFFVYLWLCYVHTYVLFMSLFMSSCYVIILHLSLSLSLYFLGGYNSCRYVVRSLVSFHLHLFFFCIMVLSVLSRFFVSLFLFFSWVGS